MDIIKGDITDGMDNIEFKDEERWHYPRFFSDNIGESAFVNSEDAKHILTVLRMKKGDKAIICDNNGMDYLCSLSDSQKEFAEFEILEKQINQAEPTVNVTLYQAIPKNDKLDFIVQKATELGVSKVVPVLTKRCVSRPDEKSMQKKCQRLNRIAYEAAKQCGRGRVPVVSDMIIYKEAISTLDVNQLNILFYECGGLPLGKIVDATKNISVFIGSEGGFEKEEVEIAIKQNVKIASLGNRILRCETAPVAAISILMNLTDNM